MSICGDSSVAELPLFQGEDGGAIPTSPLQLLFRQISEKTLNNIVTEFHYAHRPVPVSWAFGAYFNNICIGVISYGKPASRSVCVGVCGKENADRVYELNRLWMNDVCPKNSESRFIGWTLRILRAVKPSLILVSYADTAQKHLGVVYKATGWIYTGLSDKRPSGDISIPGTHSRHGRKNPEAVKIERTQKHRYVFFIDSQDKLKLRWPVLPYASGDSR